jgi:hypothetical protein
MAAERGPERPSMVSLNEVIDLLGTLSSGTLGQALAPSAPRKCQTNCDCNVRYCACHGAVFSVVQETAMSFQDYLTLREQRMAELRMQLQGLEVPPDQLPRPQARPPEG